MFLLSRKLQLIAATALSLCALLANADTLSQAINTEAAIHTDAVKSQSKIDALDDHTRKMLEQYRSATRQTKTLLTYMILERPDGCHVAVLDLDAPLVQ
ncbi:MAG: DUF3450 domain-containing protein [Methyloprofundus sp.]|nr:DUF3450 domain-containing protein [Methyloprofundus sp.]